MNRKEMQQRIISSLEDTKAQEITVLDVQGKSDMTDFMVIATGNSTRHVKSIAANLIKDMKDVDQQPLGCEGEENGEWVLVDLENIVVHVMQRDVRDFYNLEKLWGIPVSEEVLDTVS
jgi:ribosome-associated protein